jgi:hypothetical protein
VWHISPLPLVLGVASILHLMGGMEFPIQIERTPTPDEASQRREPRIACHGLAEVELGGRRRLGILTNISTGGAFVSLELGDARPVPGETVELRVFRSGASAFRAAARIAHLSAMGIGLALAQPVNGLPQMVISAS